MYIIVIFTHHIRLQLRKNISKYVPRSSKFSLFTISLFKKPIILFNKQVHLADLILKYYNAHFMFSLCLPNSKF